MQQRLAKPWLRFEKAVKEEVTPLLYHLRKKLHSPGSRTGEGWAAWVDENLSISRRACDLWTAEYAKKHGLPGFGQDEATSSNFARGNGHYQPPKKTADGKVQSTVSWVGTKEEEEQVNQAWKALGERAGEIAFKAITEAAATAEPGKKKPSGTSLPAKRRKEWFQ